MRYFLFRWARKRKMQAVSTIQSLVKPFGTPVQSASFSSRGRNDQAFLLLLPGATPCLLPFRLFLPFWPSHKTISGNLAGVGLLTVSPRHAFILVLSDGVSDDLARGVGHPRARDPRPGGIKRLGGEPPSGISTNDRRHGKLAVWKMFRRTEYKFFSWVLKRKPVAEV